MATKNFKLEINQSLWDQFYYYKIENYNNRSNKSSAAMCASQYKPGLLALEKVTNESFANITASELDQIITARKGKNKNHIIGFYITAITQGWLNVNRELILYLFPAEYKELAKKLIA